MTYCTRWEGLASVLQMNAGDVAQWIGAIGTLLAVGWAAWTYYVDRRRKWAEDDATRKISAWRQALLIRPYLKLACLHLRASAESFAENEAFILGSDSERDWLIREVDELLRLAADPLALGIDTGKDLLDFVSRCHVANSHLEAELRLHSVQDEGTHWRPPPNLRKQISELAAQGAMLMQRIDAIAESPP